MQNLDRLQIDTNLLALAKALGTLETEQGEPFTEFAGNLHHLYEQILNVLYPYLIPSFHSDESKESSDLPVLLGKGEPLDFGIEWGDLGYLGGLLWPFTSELLELLKQYYALGLFIDGEPGGRAIEPLAPLSLDIAEFESPENKRHLFWQMYLRVERWRKSLFEVLQRDWSQSQAAVPAFLELGRCLHGLLADCFLLYSAPHIAGHSLGE